MTDSGKCQFLKLGLVFLLLSLITGIAAATTVTILPDHINPDGMFTVEVKDLPNNTPITIQIAGQFGVTPASPFMFSFTNMTWPVKLDESNATVTLVNTDYNKVTLNEWDPENESQEMTYIVEGPSVGGVFERVITGLETTHPEIEPDEEHECIFSGTTASDAQSVMATVRIDLKGEGGSIFEIPVHVHGMATGVVQVSIFVDNSLIVSKELTVGVPHFDKATLQVSSIPSDAAVYIDGVYIGQSPLYTEVVSGPRIIRLTKSGYAPWEKQVFVMYSPTSATYVFAEMTVQPLGGSASAAVAAPALPAGGFTPVAPVGGALLDPNWVPFMPSIPTYTGSGYGVNPNQIVMKSVPMQFL